MRHSAALIWSSTCNSLHIVTVLRTVFELTLAEVCLLLLNVSILWSWVTSPAASLTHGCTQNPKSVIWSLADEVLKWKASFRTFFGEHLNTPLVYATEVIYQVEDLNAQVTKWGNGGEKQLAILHDDNLLRANAHLNIPGNTSQIVVSDKYGLHNSIWLILTLQAHEHISPLIRFICCFHGTRLYHYH